MKFSPLLGASAFLCFLTMRTAIGAAPVWRVTGANGGTLYLGGSIHALKGADYPLPPAFNQALEKSSGLVLESEKPTPAEERAVLKSGQYASGDGLRNHVDPRTYDYLKRLFAIMGVPETKFDRYTPWLLTLMLQSPQLYGLSSDLGVEGYLLKGARAKRKTVSGLVSAREHYAVYTGLNEKQSEGVLLLTLIPHAGLSYERNLKAWRGGDVDFLSRVSHESFRDYPAFGERILEARNRRWLPKLENYLASGRTYFVVVGAAHIGGSEGVAALLRQRGYQLEQL